MKFRKLFFVFPLLLVATVFVFGCYGQQGEEAGVQDGIETGAKVLNETLEGSKAPAAQAAGGIVNVATGNPLLGYLATLLVGAIPAVVSAIKHKKTKKALGAVITGVETAGVDDAAKKIVKESVAGSATNASVSEAVHSAVRDNT